MKNCVALIVVQYYSYSIPSLKSKHTSNVKVLFHLSSILTDDNFLIMEAKSQVETSDWKLLKVTYFNLK